MKRIIYAGTSRINALRIIAKTLAEDSNFEDCEISVNKDHNCVDVVFPDGTMSQTYAKESDSYESTRYDYKYVGEGKGEYIRITKSINRKSWDPEPGIIKHVDYVTKN